MEKIIENWGGIIVIALITIILMVTKIFVSLSWWVVLSPVILWVLILIAAPFIIKKIVDNELKENE